MNSARDNYSKLIIAQQTAAHQSPNSDPKNSASQESNRSKPTLPYTVTNWNLEFKHNVPHVRATPLFEVASVRIDSDLFKEFDSIKIYGTIILIDDHGNEFYIFDCKHRNDAKTLILDPKTPTSVFLQNFQPRGLPSKLCLLFQLKRRLHGAEKKDIVILDDYKYIDYTNKKVCYDKQQDFVFGGNQYMITVTFTIFRCALLAEVGFVVEKTGEDGSGVAIITGDIVAQTNGLSDDMSPDKCTLLAVSCEKFDFGNYTPLSTLAVPAYSMLEIRGQLSVDGKDVSGALIFQPFTISNFFHEKQIGGGPYRIRVIVYWMHGAISLPERNILEYYVKTSEKTDKRARRRPTSKILKTKKTYYIHPDVGKYLKDLEWDTDGFVTELLEIFSISVCAYGGEDSAFILKGKVKCFDGRGCLFIFDSDTTQGVSTRSNIVKLVPDIGRCLVGSHLRIVTELTDDREREISFGYAAYDERLLPGWRNKRICSVIRGQNGFAAVHYTIFTNAVLAKLSFKVVSNCSSGGGATGCKVDGSINTWYSIYDYSTQYAKEYYRSTLFEKRKDDGVELVGGEKIPLKKSGVAVPVYGLLVVEAIVYAEDGEHREELKFEESFSPEEGHDEHVKSRPGKSFSLNVEVEWERNIDPF